MKYCSQTLHCVQCRGLKYFQSLIFSKNCSSKKLKREVTVDVCISEAERRTLGSQKRNLIQRQTEKELKLSESPENDER